MVTYIFNIRVLTLPLIVAMVVACSQQRHNEPIDRYGLVSRHQIVIEAPDPLSSLTVGNGNFAFTTDITGLQTFFKEYEDGVSLGTQSNWGWHSIPDTLGYKMAETYAWYQVKGRNIPYQHQPTAGIREQEAANHFRSNPHRLHLGILRLVILNENGREIAITDIRNAQHSLDLWKGEISSRFDAGGQPVEVKVFVHQEIDQVACRISSPLIREGRLSVEWLFPYGLPVHTHAGYDFNSPEKHSSVLDGLKENSAIISRKLDNDHYFTRIDWREDAKLTETGKHRFRLTPAEDLETLEFSSLFSKDKVTGPVPGFEETEQNNVHHWREFWMTGGAVDLSGSKDPRAHELERRIVLSQYLTKINGSGNLPPQETGLTFNSWFGKFHLEMHWWHSAHFHNWQRTHYMARQLAFYRSILEQAQSLAQTQGYQGVRWPKMTSTDGINSPSSIGSYLIWQQPHLIYFAEQLFQAFPTMETLMEYADMVFMTAEFMADFPEFNPPSGNYDLIPPLIPAQEHWPLESTYNPPFELAYWYWGLNTALEWKQRLGQSLPPKWMMVRDNLPAPAIYEGMYSGIANAPDSYANPELMKDHPMVLGTVGMLPLWDKVNPSIMKNTLKKVMKDWDWAHTWGWDYPMAAMCATRLGEPGIAIEALLMDVQKNSYLKNGHNYQDDRLRIYLPGNGGLLKAVALMCAGWEGNRKNNPGFPEDGNWKVKWENLTPDF